MYIIMHMHTYVHKVINRTYVPAIHKSYIQCVYEGSANVVYIVLIGSSDELSQSIGAVW